MPRFVVTKIEGFLQVGKPASHAEPGLSAHVIDTAVNHRCVFSARTEDVAAPIKGERGVLTGWERREMVRGLARARAMELNAR